MHPQAGQVVGNKYRLVRLIGDGGMGSVYEARHEVLGTTVALKFLHPELARRQGLIARFLQEARVSASIESPHVVRVSDVDQAPGGLAYMVMEFLQGETLQRLYERLYEGGQRLGREQAFDYVLQILEGLEAAHRAGVVHRDLKPDNIMIVPTARGPLVKLLDFGIAKLKASKEFDRGLTRPGVVMGTPEYMAPEQAFSSDAVDVRADIYSMGVILFEMLAGRRPVGGDDARQIAAHVVAREVARLEQLAPDVDRRLAAAVHRAMEPLASDRFASVAELRAAILPFAQAGAAAAQEGGAPPPSPPAPTPTDPDGEAPAPILPTHAPASERASRVPRTLPPAEEPVEPPHDAARADHAAGVPSARGVAAFAPEAGAPGSLRVPTAAEPAPQAIALPQPGGGLVYARPSGTGIAPGPPPEALSGGFGAYVPAAARAPGAPPPHTFDAHAPAPAHGRASRRSGAALWLALVAVGGLGAGGVAIAMHGVPGLSSRGEEPPPPIHVATGAPAVLAPPPAAEPSPPPGLPPPLAPPSPPPVQRSTKPSPAASATPDAGPFPFPLPPVQFPSAWPIPIEIPGFPPAPSPNSPPPTDPGGGAPPATTPPTGGPKKPSGR